MDAMYSAIKGRRGGMLNDMEENAHQQNDDKPESVPSGESDMQGLVASLAPEQKQELLAMLVKDQAQAPEESNPAAIQEGAMGKGEMAELEQGAMEDEGDGHESEEQIMESMISSADSTRADQGATPRNLGERVKMNLATKLKNKGKG